MGVWTLEIISLLQLLGKTFNFRGHQLSFSLNKEEKLVGLS